MPPTVVINSDKPPHYAKGCEFKEKKDVSNDFICARIREHPICGEMFWYDAFDTYKEDGGFDVGDVPNNVDPRLTPIAPNKVLGRPDADIKLKKVEKYSKLALDKYNKDNKTKFEFGKFLKANVTNYSCRL
ncbi:hypothetical protein RHMOL_Rhmol01G0374800 [Rhododendron molle]|uniref:Uncharacterized protein n=2 Tax=Rhododendron molle TaxID=49168 RepID=A0ACC0Q9L1_RHOML|nr:hypothetical protein RHMOL_Rhmol01G0374800 [Rhododendron molle]KAI8574700.1 hypothetical protein RHMOL_Rhmol01G0374800 [Rhododendron molle]